jgi:predicted kinase
LPRTICNRRPKRVAAQEKKVENVTAKGLWNIVLSGYPRAGKTKLAKQLVNDHQYFVRLGVDELRSMFFNENFPCRDEYMTYSMLAEMRDALLHFGYSVIVDSTAPFNVTRQFLLTTRVKPVNPLLVVVTVDKPILAERTLDKYGDENTVLAYEKRWENPREGFPIFKFKSNNVEEFNDYYARLQELLQSETHPYKPEFHSALLSGNGIKKTLKNFFAKRSQRQKAMGETACIQDAP